MATKLLTEIERYRELMGVKLLKEVTLPKSWFASFAEAFGKSEDDLFETLGKSEDEIADASEKILKREFDDIAQSSGKSLEDFITELKAGTVGDDILDELALKLLKSADDTIRVNTVNAFIKEIPSLKKVYTYIDDPEKIKDIYKTGDDELIKTFEDIGPMIDNLPVGDETKKFIKQSFESNKNIAKQEVQKIADDAAEQLRKLQEELQAQADVETLARQVEQNKLLKASNAKKQVEALEGAGKLPKEEADALNKYLDELIASDPNATTESIVLRGQQKLKQLQKQIDDALAKSEQLSKEKKQSLLNAAKKVQNFLDLSRRIGKDPGNRSAGWAAVLNIVFYSAIIAGIGYGYTFAFGGDIDSGELDLIKEGIRNSIGDCLKKEQIVVDFLGGKFPSKDDVFDPNKWTGEAVVKIPINKEIKTIVFDPKDTSWKIYQTATVVKCGVLAGVGVNPDGMEGVTPTPTPTPTGDGVLTDDQILALWKSVNPDGEKRADGFYYKTKEASVDYSYDPTTKTFK